MTATITLHAGYTPTTHIDILIRNLDPEEQGLLCRCNQIARGIMRHLPTGTRELVCKTEWHCDQAHLDNFAAGALAEAAQHEQWRAEDAAYMAANPWDTDYAEQSARNWALIEQGPPSLPA